MQQAPTIVHDRSEPRWPDRVVLLGASGFLGRHLLSRLLEAGVDVVAPSSGQLNLSSPDAAAGLTDILKPSDAVVFLAATKLGLRLDHDGFVENVAMGAALCNAVRKARCAHVVYMSSDAVYPFTDVAIREDAATAPTSLYALMHLSREIMLRNLGEPPLAILRVTQVYGAGDPHGAYGPRRMVRSALSEGKIVLYGTGQETRDHIHVADVTSVISEVLKRRSRGLTNIATGRSTSFAALAELVARGCGGSVRLERAPPRMPVLHRTFDTTALDAAFPGRLQTSLEDGIAILIDQERHAGARAPSASDNRAPAVPHRTGAAHESSPAHKGGGENSQSQDPETERVPARRPGSVRERDRPR